MRDCDPLDVLSNILDEVPDLVFAYSSDGRYLYVNRSAAAFLGEEPLDVIGNHWRDMGYSEEIMVPLTSRIAEVAHSCEPAYVRFTSSEARGSRVFDMSLTALRCDAGDVLAVLAIARDVSEFF